MIYTFWAGKMPDYIRLCLDTWRLPYTMLDFDTVNDYTELPIDKLKKYSLPQIADVVRVHVLRDNGGYWLDADTIMLKDTLPQYEILGDPITMSNTIGMLHTKPGTEMYIKWARYQDEIIESGRTSNSWSLMGNDFTDPYLLAHRAIDIGGVIKHWPEAYIIPGDIDRRFKYPEFYFNQSYSLRDIYDTDIIMLHNSWTPKWYKDLDAVQVLQYDCTLSNFLEEVLE